MRILRRTLIIAAIVAAGIGWQTGARADESAPAAGVSCPQYGGWVLYHQGPGGSGGIEGAYSSSHGACVSFFVLHPDFAFIAVVYSNPHP
jgi:hypothetical protein